MKKIILLLVSLLIISTLFQVAVFASDEGKEDWEIYENYLYYENDGTKTTGYTIEGVYVFISDRDVINCMDLSFFPEIETIIDSINEVDYGVYYLKFKKPDSQTGEKIPIYSEEDIDEYIGFLKYLEGLDYVSGIRTEKITIEPFDIHYDWEEYTNYYFYKNGGPEGAGYLIDGVLIKVDHELLEENELSPSMFPEIEDKIIRITRIYLSNIVEYTIEFKNYISPHDSIDYTEEEIDEFIEIVKYINNFDFVINVTPNMLFTADICDVSETTIQTEQNVGAETQDEDTTESSSTGAVKETEPLIKGENAETGSADVNQNKLHNPQTGDKIMLYTAVCLAAVSLIVFAVVLKKSRLK
jgi:hypothetical protein